MGSVTRELARRRIDKFLNETRAEVDISTTTFGPLDKYVAANDNYDLTELRADLMDIFSYDPETGVFRRKVAPRLGKVIDDKSANGYIRIRHKDKAYGAHRVAWLFMTGNWPEQDVDHVNLDRADNRWTNLRAASRSENLGNIGARSDNKSGLKGAYYSKRLRKWQSFIQIQGKHDYLGLFATAEEAHAAYVKAASERFGEFARASKDDVRVGEFLQTFTGRKYWPMSPRPHEVYIEDIAHSLGLQCRYAGHCIKFYSVAEHSVLIARHLAAKHAPEVALAGLLHDAPEAYCVDIPRPLKPYLTNYRAIEQDNWLAIAARFRLPKELPREVHDADNRIIADELVNLREMPWHARYAGKELGVKLRYWSPEEAELEFLATFDALMAGRAA